MAPLSFRTPSSNAMLAPISGGRPSQDLAAQLSSLSLSSTTHEIQLLALQSSFNKPTLQTLPREVRDVVWYFITEDTVQTSDQKWKSKPPNDYNGVAFSCRQFYFETETFWRRFFLSSARLASFFSQKYSPDRVSSYKVLSLEIPLSIAQEFYRRIAMMLKLLAPHLQELKLFFVGADRFGIEPRHHGCGNRIAQTPSTAKKLIREGQGIKDRMVLVHALADLHNLRTLVISNINFPLMESHVAANKPYLEKLYIVGDPRSEHHVPYNRENSGYLVNTYRQALNLTHLHIGTNTVVSASRIVHRAAKTLKHLTWVIPDPARQVDTSRSSWYTDTRDVLRCLQSPQAQLESLKICSEGDIYNCDYQYGHFLEGLHSSLQHLEHLKTLELHISLKTSWDAPEILERLPPSLEKLYLSDRFIEFDILCDRLEGWYLHSQTHHQDHSDCIPREHTGRPELGKRPARRWCSTLQDGDFVGKSTPRRDQSRFTSCGRLRFVGFEHSRAVNEDVAEERRMRLLKLNARLLDKEQNRHMHGHTGPKHLAKGMLIRKEDLVKKDPSPDIWHFEPPSREEVASHVQSLLDSGFTDDLDYFGKEGFAEKVFHKENPVSLEKLEARIYPVEVVADRDTNDDRCHWASER